MNTLRFIPTCVGLILIQHVNLLCSSVHPHVRGVNAECPNRAVSDVRFIPTCVGLMFLPL